MKRNFNTIHEIEERKKIGKGMYPSKSPTPKKNIKQHICKKFKGNPVKFFSNKPPKNLLKKLDIDNNNNNNTIKNSERFNKYKNSVSRIDTGLKKYKNENNKNTRKKLNEFVVNSEPSRKKEKEKALRNIISNINLEESMNATSGNERDY